MNFYPAPHPNNEPLAELTDDDGKTATLVIVDDAVIDGQPFQIFPTFDADSVVVAVSHRHLNKVAQMTDDEQTLEIVLGAITKALVAGPPSRRRRPK